VVGVDRPTTVGGGAVTETIPRQYSLLCRMKLSRRTTRPQSGHRCSFVGYLYDITTILHTDNIRQILMSVCLSVWSAHRCVVKSRSLCHRQGVQQISRSSYLTLTSAPQLLRQLDTPQLWSLYFPDNMTRLYATTTQVSDHSISLACRNVLQMASILLCATEDNSLALLDGLPSKVPYSTAAS